MEPHKIKDVAVTIIDVSVNNYYLLIIYYTIFKDFFFSSVTLTDVQVFDQSALSLEAKEDMYKLYPNARRAHLKTGGNFPYLCRSAEVNLYIQVEDRDLHSNTSTSSCSSLSSLFPIKTQWVRKSF